ncbi:hypothetical protein ACM26V_07895 [Salipaludibacillus sp. HK11]
MEEQNRRERVEATCAVWKRKSGKQWSKRLKQVLQKEPTSSLP